MKMLKRDKSKYVTRDDLNDIKLSLIIISITIVAVVLLVVTATFGGGPSSVVGRLVELEMVIASEYNFTEEECVRWQFHDNVCNQMCAPYGEFCKKNCIEVRKQVLGDCSLYCHTEKKQVGEECRLETGNFRGTSMGIIGFGATKDNLIPYVTKYGFNLDCNLSEGQNYTQCFNCTLSSSDWYDCERLFIRKVCTPIYETKIIEGSCKTGDEVRKARELIR